MVAVICIVDLQSIKLFNDERVTRGRTKIRHVLLIVVCWTFTGFLMSIHDHFVLYSVISKGPGPDYHFLNKILINSSVGFVTGWLAGSFMVYYVNIKFKQSPYWVSIVLVGGFFFLMSGCLITLVSFIESTLTITGKERENFQIYFFESIHVKNILIWFPVLILTQIALQINDKFGPHMFWNFIIGRYNVPKEEMRIFMFLDIKSSTMIAERLGNKGYHLFLRDFYSDITPAIVENYGEIYQYVGDEIVISWTTNGKRSSANCLKCFFDISTCWSGLSGKYKISHGLVPEFKAGIHFGKVMTGEIGAIKRDITFSGDVLNTTARIQAMCNELGVRILCSDDLLKRLPSDAPFSYHQLGEVYLKGKERSVALSTVAPKS